MTHDVLPTIRKTGGYLMVEGHESDPEIEALARDIAGRAATANLGLNHQLNLHQLAIKLADKGRAAALAHLQNLSTLYDSLHIAKGRAGKLVKAVSVAGLVGEFIAECCLADEGASVPASALYRAFGQWLRDRHGLNNTISQKRFGAAVGDAGFERSKAGTFSYDGLCLAAPAIEAGAGAQ